MASTLAEAEESQRCLVPESSADKRWLQRACQRESVVRPLTGIYARTAYWNSLSVRQQALHMMRALMQCHPTWVFAGYSAALAHGLEVGNTDIVQLCRATSRRSHARTTDELRTIIVTGDQAVIRNDVRVTSFARTMYDCIRMSPFPSALAIGDSALRVKHIDAERLAQNVLQLCQGQRSRQRVLDIIALADGRAENGGESKVRAQILRLGFAVPDLQRQIPDPLDPSTTFRVDFAWDLPDATVVIGELDGKDKYQDPAMTKGRQTTDVLLDERRREAHLTLGEQPIRIMRFSFAESQNGPEFEKLLSSYGIPRSESIPSVALAA